MEIGSVNTEWSTERVCEWIGKTRNEYGTGHMKNIVKKNEKDG